MPHAFGLDIDDRFAQVAGCDKPLAALSLAEDRLAAGSARGGSKQQLEKGTANGKAAGSDAKADPAMRAALLARLRFRRNLHQVNCLLKYCRTRCCATLGADLAACTDASGRPYKGSQHFIVDAALAHCAASALTPQLAQLANPRCRKIAAVVLLMKLDDAVMRLEAARLCCAANFGHMICTCPCLSCRDVHVAS